MISNFKGGEREIVSSIHLKLLGSQVVLEFAIIEENDYSVTFRE